jgi:PAS domain S-box-containing protein
MAEEEKINILVVDDEKIITMHLEELLSNMGYNVVGTASSGVEAIQMATELKPDLIFMDIIMPGDKSGIDAASEIKEKLNIPVIFLTAFADDHIVEKAKLSQPFNFIVKPFKGHELKAAIEIAIYKKSMERKLEESEEKYRTLVEDSRDGIAIIQDGVFKYLNPALSEMLRKPKDINDTFFLYHFEENCRDQAEQLYYSGMDGQDVPSINQFSLFRKDDTYMPVETNISKISYEGRPAILSFFRSIEQRKTVERTLDYLVQEINGRNQIAIPNIENLMNKTKDKRLKEQLKTVHSLLFDNAKTIKKAYRLLSTECEEIEPLYVDPMEKINEANMQLSRQYPEKRISIKTEMAMSTPKVLADDFLEDALYILFERIIKNTQMETVNIGVKIKEKGPKKNRRVEIHVEDKNLIVRDEDKDRIFESFAISQKNEDMSYGLSIIKSLLERFSGDIGIGNLVNEDHTQGSVFIITLFTKYEPKKK